MNKFIIFKFFFLLIILNSCSSGNGNNGDNSNQPTISQNAILLTQETTNEIESIDKTAKKIVFKTIIPQISEIQTNTIIVIPKSNITPDGMLIKVISSTESQGKLIIEYESASLTELIENGEINISQTELTENDIDEIELEDESSSSDNISIVNSSLQSKQSSALKFNIKGTHSSGSASIKSSLNLNIGYNFKLKIKSFSLNYLKVTANVTEKAYVIATTKAGTNANFKKRVGRIKFKPVTVWVGWIPVYIRPVLYFYIGTNAKAQAMAVSNVIHNLSYKVGIKYDDKWSPINDYQKEFVFTPPSLKKANAQVKGYIEPQLVFWIYGTTGPYLGVDGYLLLKVDALKNPWCDFSAGIQGFAGAKLLIFSKKLANVHLNLFDVNKSLYKCADPYLVVSPESTLNSYGPKGGNFSPKSITFILSSSNTSDVQYKVSSDVNWLDISNSNGTVNKSNSQNVVVSLNQNANELSEGTYIGTLNFQNTSNPDKGSQTRTVTLTVREPTFTVSPFNDAPLLGTDYEGSSFSNTSQMNYTLSVDVGSVNWQITEYPKWLSISQTSGNVSDTSPQAITISVNSSEASNLPVGTQKGIIKFVTKSKDGKTLKETNRTIYLQVKMNVNPLLGQIFSFPEGGTTNNQHQPWTYSIKAINGSINWEAKVSQDWLTIDNNGNNIIGTVQKGSQKDLSIYQNISKLKYLNKGIYNANLEIINLESGVFEDKISIPITVNVIEPFNVSPNTLNFNSMVGGPVTPFSEKFIVNSDFDNIDIQVTSDKNWVVISNPFFTISKNVPQDVNISLSSDVNNFSEGTYTATVTFTKTNGEKQIEIQRTVKLTIEKQQPAKLIWVGTLSQSPNPDPLQNTIPADISDDGSVVVGGSWNSNGKYRAFRWKNGIIQDLGTFDGTTDTLNNNDSEATGISSDGSVVVGWAIGTDINGHVYTHAFRWENGNMQDLGTFYGITNRSSRATDVSANGKVVVGYSDFDDPRLPSTHAFRWENGNMQDLGSLSNTFNPGTAISYSIANAVSSDGNVVVGWSYTPDGKKHAFRWENNFMQDLGTLGGSKSESKDVSSDGSVVVGWSETSNGEKHAFRWKDGTMQDLGTLGGNESIAYGVSADGSTVVGYAKNSSGYYKPFIWTAQYGMVNIEEKYTNLLTSCTTSDGTNWYDSLFKLVTITPNRHYLLGEGNHCGTYQSFIIDRGNSF